MQSKKISNVKSDYKQPLRIGIIRALKECINLLNLRLAVEVTERANKAVIFFLGLHFHLGNKMPSIVSYQAAHCSNVCGFVKKTIY